VSIRVSASATNHPFGVYDKASQSWMQAEGDFQAYVGTSSSPSDLHQVSGNPWVISEWV
jgi:hypothetical protein